MQIKWAIVYEGKAIEVLSSRIDAIRVWQEMRQDYLSEALLERWEDGISTATWTLL